MRKSVFMSGVAMAAMMAMAGTAQAQQGDETQSAHGELSAHFGTIDPFFGHIDPFFGTIDPFFGTIDPFFGHIDPFNAHLNPTFGDISPFWGTIDPFFGDINPFFGDIDAFWGDISPSFGTIDPFFGHIDPFYGDLDAFWGDIAAFWQDIGPMWGDLNAFWGDLDAFSDDQAGYEELQQRLLDMETMTEALWGGAVEAQTGKSFHEGFADALYAKYGIDLDDPSTLENLDVVDRSKFFLDYYDGLMEFSGIDRVDHWMGTINWRPAITQDLGGGSDAVIGLLDANIHMDQDLLDNISKSRGYQVTGNFHGAAVASLLIADHDGRGLMGIAPDADVTLYNPFDDSGTTNWDDVRDGLIELGKRKADVVNMSLGMPGWVLHEGWADVLSDHQVTNKLRSAVIVKAAGNDGITQEEMVLWTGDRSLYDQLIIVGSVGPTEVISPFSNRPGESCLSYYTGPGGGGCTEHEKLKYRFLVAPGEYILVSDDMGGTTRVSGTSFAAPLVSGTATLIADRWPWLQNSPELISNIILTSAKDLGEPGVDGVYGWGLLDVEAALSPLVFDNLQVYEGWNYINTSDLKEAILTPGTLELWEDSGVVLSSFEYLAGGHRDFLIPLSTRVFGEEYGQNRNFQERTQSYLYQRLIDWAHGEVGFTDTRSYSAPIKTGDNWMLSMTARPRSIAEERFTDDVPFHSDVMLTNTTGTLALRMGTGEARAAFTGGKAFGFASDHDPYSGGVNPVFGFASGSSYAGAALALNDRATFSMTYSRSLDEHVYEDRYTGEIVSEELGLAPYLAEAANMTVNYRFNERLSLNLGYTSLTETDGLLGAQGGGLLSLDGQAETKAATMGFDVELPRNISLGFSATRGETRNAKFDGAAFVLAEGGAVSSAYEVAALKQGVFGKRDELRFSFAQPLHVEDGALELRSMGVIDRQTGEIGPTTQYIPLGGALRPYVAEMLYATPLKGIGDVSTFTRAETNTRAQNAGIVEYTMGANLKISF